MFAQLGSFINQMSEETGTGDVWKKKLAELEKAAENSKMVIRELVGQLREVEDQLDNNSKIDLKKLRSMASREQTEQIEELRRRLDLMERLKLRYMPED